MDGYGRSYSQRVVIVAPDRGIPKWRAVLLVVGVLVLLSNLPGGGPQSVQADQFTVPGTVCATTDKALVSFDMTGYQAFSIAFRLVTTGGGPFVGAWRTASSVGNSHWPAPLYWYGGAASDPDKTFYVYGGTGGAGTGVVLDGARSGTVQYVVGKAAGYAGCFSVYDVVVTRHPSAFTGGVTPPPLPTPTPGPTAPTGYDCNGSTDVEDCDDPPDGYCWVEVGGPYGSVAHELQECEDESNGVGGTGTGEPDVTCGNIANGSGTTFSYDPPSAGYVYIASVELHVTWAGSSTYGLWFGSDRIGGRLSAGAPNHTDDVWRSPIFYGDGTSSHANLNHGAPIGVWGGAGAGYFATDGSARTGQGFFDGGTYATNSGYTGSVCWEFSTDGPGSFEPTTDDSDGDGWTDGEEATCGSDPEDEDDYCQMAAPSGFPSASGLPGQNGSGGGPSDQCEGPDDAALTMCQTGDLTVNVNVDLCDDHPDAAICQDATEFEAGGEAGAGTDEDGALGGAQGHGLTECEGDNLTPVESKVGYIAPEAVPTVTPLATRLAGFDIFALDRAPGYVVGAVGWVGDMVGVIPPSVRNTATGVYNAGVHLIVPGDCIGTMVESKFTEVMEEPPFSLWAEVSDAVESGASGAGGVGLAGIPLMGGGTVAFPMDELAAAMAPVRPILAAAVWLSILLAIGRIVLRSFHVGGGGGSE